MKLYDGGRPNESLFRIVEANTRAPVPVLGDIHAQVACNDVGARSLLALMREFGLDSLDELSDAIIRRSEEALRRAIAALPDGEYTSETTADGLDAPVRIKTRVAVVGDGVTVDYTGTSAQDRRGINVPLNYTTAYTTFAIKAAIGPEVPNNGGSFRPVRVIAPPGCILNAQPPAPAARAPDTSRLEWSFPASDCPERRPASAIWPARAGASPPPAAPGSRDIFCPGPFSAPSGPRSGRAPWRRAPIPSA